MNIKKIAATAFWYMTAFSAIWSCTGQTKGFSEAELALIHNADSIMRVLTIEDSMDLKVLRNKSTELSLEEIMSEDYSRLAELMVATVTHPSQDGVGIAAPQVGLNRRIVAVQRFDKPGEPFEVYPNIRIIWASDSLASGPEGCLSVPEMRGEVMRSTSVIIEYDQVTQEGHAGTHRLETVKDTINGFTAVIFQHETDHLDGILYIDRILPVKSDIQ